MQTFFVQHDTALNSLPDDLSAIKRNKRRHGGDVGSRGRGLVVVHINLHGKVGRA